jgi:hypothetical protein
MSLQFHHIGVACLDLDADTHRLAALGYAVEGRTSTIRCKVFAANSLKAADNAWNCLTHSSK